MAKEIKTNFICLRCQKEIEPNDAHIKIMEFDKGQAERVFYMHKSCWEGRLTPFSVFPMTWFGP